MHRKIEPVGVPRALTDQGLVIGPTIAAGRLADRTRPCGLEVKGVAEAS
jgi:hypothetical protein